VAPQPNPTSKVRLSTCLLGSCLSAPIPRRAVYLICACLKVLTCPFLSPPVQRAEWGQLTAKACTSVSCWLMRRRASSGVDTLERQVLYRLS
jgi:hypothetical protein